MSPVRFRSQAEFDAGGALDEERELAIREYEARKASSPLPAWSEIDLNHGSHDHAQGARWTIGPEACLDVLDKLLGLNFYRYYWEKQAGLRSGRNPAKGKRVQICHGAAAHQRMGRPNRSTAPSSNHPTHSSDSARKYGSPVLLTAISDTRGRLGCAVRPNAWRRGSQQQHIIACPVE